MNSRIGPGGMGGLACAEGESLGAAFRAIAELAGDVAWIVDAGSVAGAELVYVSESLHALLGVGPAALARQLAGAAPDAPLAVLGAALAVLVARCVGGESAPAAVSVEQRAGDGRMVALEIVARLLPGRAGAPARVVGQLRDLGPTRALAEAQRRFAAMLNHEFRTPLSTIDGAVQRLEAGGAQVDAATRQRYARIQAAVDRLTGMLDTYLSPERMDAIGQQRPPGAMAPAALLEEGAAQARAAGRSVTLDAADLPAAIRCEPAGLRLALAVLVRNALVYTPAGSALALCGRRADGGIELLVRDHGPGVPADELEHIFGKHVRGSNSAGLPGSGLGLYMARSVVEVHGGSLGVRNVGQDGAEFRLWLPAHGGAGKSMAADDMGADEIAANEIAANYHAPNGASGHGAGRRAGEGGASGLVRVASRTDTTAKP